MPDEVTPHAEEEADAQGPDRLAAAALPDRGGAAAPAGPVVRGDRGSAPDAARHGEGPDPPRAGAAEAPHRRKTEMRAARIRQRRTSSTGNWARPEAASRDTSRSAPPAPARWRSYRLVFDRLGNLPLWEPSAELVDRVLAEAMPAHPARWVKFAGYAYAASLVASLGGLACSRPTERDRPRAWMGAPWPPTPRGPSCAPRCSSCSRSTTGC